MHNNTTSVIVHNLDSLLLPSSIPQNSQRSGVHAETYLNQPVQTYIAFASADKKSVSNRVWVGIA